MFKKIKGLEIHPPLVGGSKNQRDFSGRGRLKNAKHFYTKEALARAKTLRENQTDPERILWYFLSRKQMNGLKFRRQVPLLNYIVDFVCFEKKLVIELDGGQHNEPEKIHYDTQRTKDLEKSGFRVLRFWNDDVFENVEGLLNKIYNEVTPPRNA